MPLCTEETKWTPFVGSYIEPDTWKIGGVLQGSFWDKAEFYIESGNMIDVKYAVNIKQVFNREREKRGSTWRRVKIEWVKDGEPNVTSLGWMISNKVGRFYQENYNFKKEQKDGEKSNH